MNRYWDLSEYERSRLTEEDVRDCLKVHLMEEGVLEPAPLDLRPEVSVEVEKHSRCGVHIGSEYGGESIYFASEEDRESFLAMKLLKRSIAAGDQWVFLPADVARNQATAISESDAARLGRELQERASIEKHNTEERKRFEDERRAADECAKKVWDDWYKCSRLGAAFKQMDEILEEYVVLCGGDRDKAMMFLRKAKGDAAVEQALQWHPNWQHASKLDEIAISSSERNEAEDERSHN